MGEHIEDEEKIGEDAEMAKERTEEDKDTLVKDEDMIKAYLEDLRDNR